MDVIVARFARTAGIAMAAGVMMIGPEIRAANQVGSVLSEIKIPANVPKWSLRFSKFSYFAAEAKRGGPTNSGNVFLEIRYIKAPAVPDRPKTMQPRGAPSPIMLVSSFSVDRIHLQRNLQAIRQLPVMANRSVAAGDFSERITEVGGTQKDAATIPGIYLVCRESKFYGLLKQFECSIDDVNEIVEILTNWAKYEAEAKKQGYKPQ